jgi:hypothetical protein
MHINQLLSNSNHSVYARRASAFGLGPRAAQPHALIGIFANLVRDPSEDSFDPQHTKF